MPSRPEHSGGTPDTVLQLDEARRADVEQKQNRVAMFLKQHGFDALLLVRPQNVAWFTAGAEVARGTSETVGAVFATPEARVMVTNNIDSARLFERDLYGMGFQLKERRWQEPREILLTDLCRGRRVASDVSFGDAEDVSDKLASLRLPLTGLECTRLKKLGAVAVHAVEATGRNFEAGQTEAEVAGEVAHRLVKRTVIPERIQVCADERLERFRHWSFGSDPIHHSAVISCVARRWGLCVGVSRTIAFGQVPTRVRKAHNVAMMLQATGMFFSTKGRQLDDLWSKVHRIYEKNDLQHEWHAADQGGVIGFGTNEIPLVVNQDHILQPNTAIHWHPSVGPAMVGDTLLIGAKTNELITPLENWPVMKVTVRGVPMQVADILIRHGSSEMPVQLSETGLLDLDEADSEPGPMDTRWELNVSEITSRVDSPTESTLAANPVR